MLLLAFGGNAALLAVLGWLARSLLGQVFAKDLERFKSDLAAASSAATEKLKHEFQLVAQEHQVLVSKLHERCASCSRGVRTARRDSMGLPKLRVPRGVGR